MAVLLLLVVVAGLYLLWKVESEPAWEISPPHPFGSALLASSSGGDRLLFLAHRQEQERYRSRNVGPGARQIYELRAYSTATLQPVWTTTLLREAGGHPDVGEMRLLGEDGERVWVFVREPVLVSLADGAIVAGAPAYVPPPKPNAAGARQLGRIRRLAGAPGARGGHPRDEVPDRRCPLRRRLVRRALGGRGDEVRAWGTTPVLADGDLGSLALLGEPGEHDRFVDLQRLGDSTFVAGGLLREAGSVEPLRATEPDGAFVLHREVTPERGSWRVARVDLAGESRWDVELPIGEIEQLWRAGDAVLMVGPRAAESGGDRHRLLIALDAAAGDIRSTDLESDPPATR